MLCVNLEVMAEMINLNTCETATVKRTYKDFGQGTMFDMVIVNSHGGGYQALNFREQEEAADGRMSLENAEKIINKINERGW